MGRPIWVNAVFDAGGLDAALRGWETECTLGIIDALDANPEIVPARVHLRVLCN